MSTFRWTLHHNNGFWNEFLSGMELPSSITLAMSIAHKSYRMKTKSNISHENGPFDMKIQPRYVH